MTRQISRRTVLKTMGATSALAVAGIPALPARADATAPALYPEQLRNLVPATAVQLSGAGFTATCALRLWHVPDDTTPPSGGVPALPAVPPAGAVALTPAGVTATSMAAIPPSGTRTVTAAYVSSADVTTWSSPLLLNAAEPWFHTRPAPEPGQAIDVIGLNLHLGGGTPAAYLRDSSGTLHACAVTVVSRFELTLTVPASVAPGSYDLLVSNGHGGHHGYSERLTVQVTAPAAAPTGSIDVVIDHGADPTGTADSTAAIQAALDAAATTAGGAVVSIPAGHYAVSGRMTFPATSNPIHLVGDGQGSTTVRMSDASAFGADFPLETPDDVYGVGPTDQKSLFYLDAANGAVVIRDLSIDANDRRAVGIGVNRRHNVTIQRTTVVCNDYPADVWLRTGANGIFAYGCRNLRVLECEIDSNNGVVLGAVLDVEIADCALRACFPRVNGEPNHPQPDADNTAIKIAGSRRIAVRRNDFQRSSATFYYARGVGAGGSKLAAFSYGPDEACGLEDVIVAHNTLDGAGEPHGNNGEAFVGDTFTTKPGERVQLHVTGATPTTVTVPTGTFDTAGSFDVIGAHVFVLSGTGEGQVRRVQSHTTDTVTVAEPWSVVPDSTSIITVVIAHVRQLYVHNTVTTCPKYLGNYGPSYYSVCAENTFDGDGAFPSGSTGLDQGVGGAAALRGTAPSFDYKIQFYNEVSDNDINTGRVFYSYTNTAGASTTPAGPIVRSNALVRNTVTNSPEAAKLFTTTAAAAAPWGRYNLSALNLGVGSSTSTVIGAGFDTTYYQGPATGLADAGSGTVLL
ncbi:glycosyl hydrolase family 28-related protein [Jiangella endophytica]|uniref:glycosyl hydrolase family 28-related protein n=1 Tax=Jiangella endophytica TaxID=1623398 RepID=UPI000E3466BC|nr:glycosyl hydrolase family 28-related protein [Jiangella endophytica]